MNDQGRDHSGDPAEPLLDAFAAPAPEAWRAEVERLLKGVPFERAMFTRTLEGLTVGSMTTAADAADLPWAEHAPGEAPFLRGATAGGHLVQPWLVAQEIPLTTVEDFNNALRHDLKRGQNAVNLILDQAGCRGLDPDQAGAGQVGCGGTSIASLDELSVALDGVDLATTPVFIQAGTSVLPLAALLAGLVRRRGGDPAQLHGCIGCDPVFGLAKLGELSLSTARLYDELAVLTRWSVHSAPHLRTLPVHENAWHDGGADSALSLGLTLATAVSTLRAMEERGIALAEAVKRIQFRMCVGGDFFTEMAKFRALRLLWSDVQRAAGLDPVPAVVHARTSRRTQTLLDPHVNLLRSATQAMSAVLGGVQSLHVAAFDEVKGGPDEFSRRIARNVHLLLSGESRLDRVMDPAGGSWYVETLTADLARAAWQSFQEIEEGGGVVDGLRSGGIQERVAACADERRRRLATRRDVIVGTNRYANPLESLASSAQEETSAVSSRRAAQVAEQRTGEADHAGVMEQLTRVLESDTAELFSHMESAATHGATLGELVSILRHDDRPDAAVVPIPLRRDAAPFEELRVRVERGRVAKPASGHVWCACLGDPARYMPRLDFTRDFFRVGGCEVTAEGFHDDPAGTAAAALDSGASTVVIVGLDPAYADSAADLARALKAGDRKPLVVLAGRGGDLEETLTAAGVDLFIHARSDALDTLGHIADRMEVEA